MAVGSGVGVNVAVGVGVAVGVAVGVDDGVAVNVGVSVNAGVSVAITAASASFCGNPPPPLPVAQPAKSNNNGTSQILR